MGTDDQSAPPWKSADEPSWVAGIRRSFADHLPDRLAAASRARGELAGEGLSDEGRTGLFTVAHQISGTAASIGGHRLGRAARAVAEQVDFRGGHGRRPDAGDLEVLLAELEAAAAEFLRWVDDTGDPLAEDVPAES